MMVVERSPVTLLQVRRMSCQHDGSKIEIHPPLGVDLPRLPSVTLSAAPYLLGTCCSLSCCKGTFSPASVCLTLRVARCVGEELACFHPPIQRASALQYRIYIVLKSVVLTHPPMWSVLSGDISPPHPHFHPRRKKEHGKVWSASWTQTGRRIEKTKTKTIWPQSLIFWQKKNWGYGVPNVPDKV